MILSRLYVHKFGWAPRGMRPAGSGSTRSLKSTIRESPRVVSYRSHRSGSMFRNLRTRAAADSVSCLVHKTFAQAHRSLLACWAQKGAWTIVVRTGFRELVVYCEALIGIEAAAREESSLARDKGPAHRGRASVRSRECTDGSPGR